MLLTVKQIECAKPIEGQRRTKLSDGNKLFVYITPTGYKSYVMEYRFEGKPSSISLGPCSEKSLKEARSNALEIRANLAKGINPKVPVKQQENSVEKGATFHEVYEEVCAFRTQPRKDEKPLWSATTVKNHNKRFTKHVLPHLGSKRIQDITESDLRGVLLALQERGTFENRNKVKSALNVMFDYALNEKYITVNVAQHIPKTLFIKSKSKPYKHVTTSYELKDVVWKINEMTNTSYMVHQALKLGLLVFLRPAEIVGLRWSYIDFDMDLITIPADDMKESREHLVPISKQVKSILMGMLKMTGHDEFVFASNINVGRSIVPDSLGAALRRHGIKEISPHGFRHTASTILNEKDFDEDAIELQLSHIIGGVRGTYNKAKKLKLRYEIMQVWADHIDMVLVTDKKDLIDF